MPALIVDIPVRVLSLLTYPAASGGIVTGFGQMMAGLPAGSSVDYAYFNFTNDNKFTGAAHGSGYAGKIGLVYAASEKVTLGLTYHSTTQLSDLTASGSSISRTRRTLALR